MATTIILARYSDNVAPNVTALTASAEDAEYPAGNLVDLMPDSPAKLTTTTGNFVFDWGAAQRQDAIAVIMHNIAAGLEVRWQNNATDSWGAPTLNEALTVPSDWEDGYPVNFFKQLTSASGYSASGFRYGRLVVVGTNAAAVAIGEVVVLSQVRTLSYVAAEIQVGERREDIQHRTDYESVTAYDRAVPVRTYEADLFNVATTANIDSHWRDARGRFRPFLFVPDASVNDPWLVRYMDRVHVKQYLKTQQVVTRTRLRLEEVGKGLYL